MKKNPEKEAKMSLRELRNLEADLGIFLENPKSPSRCSNQQFGVYDEDEEYVGEIVAGGQFFTNREIREKVKSLFNRQA